MSEITMREGNNLNNLDRNNHPNRSKFEFVDSIAFTPRFGEITPFFCRRVEDTDKFSNRAEFDLRTFTLQSPLMQELKMYKNYFSVPIEAILPINWKTKIYPNPTIGDDVPHDAYTFTSLDLSFFNLLLNANFNDSTSNAYSKSNAITGAITLINIFNSSSLANLLGYGFPRVDESLLYNELLTLCSYVQAVRIYSYDDSTYENAIYYIPIRTLSNTAKLHRIITLASDYPCLFEFGDTTGYDSDRFTGAINNFLQSVKSKNGGSLVFKVDLARLWAYQLVCAHFYSNDKVDFIYNSELFRQSIYSLYCQINGAVVSTFSYNGQTIQYDYLSAKYLENACISLNSGDFTLDSSEVLYFLRYLNAIFSYRRSLKYEDYFTGARPRPLAIGNDSMPVSVDVNTQSGSSSVSVVDITRSIQAQKFLNQINRTGRKFSNYLAGLFGKAPSQDWHDPQFLASFSETVYGQETRNTGSDQFSSENSITTNLRCNSNNFEVSAEFDRQCIMLGLVSFDIVRYYDNGTVRDTLIRDRYDMFNPYMQYIGDQSLLLAELDRTIAGNLVDKFTYPFGYSTRYLDLKTSFPRACGAFATNKLPSWIFKASDLMLREANGREDIMHINPDYIRSYPAELDDYYINGVGVAGADWFHFILLVKNHITALRPMAVNPQILG